MLHFLAVDPKKLLKLSYENEPANQGALEGLLASGYSPLEVDRLLENPTAENFVER